MEANNDPNGLFWLRRANAEIEGEPKLRDVCQVCNNGDRFEIRRLCGTGGGGRFRILLIEVRSRLPAGGSEIRTVGPARERDGPFGGMVTQAASR